MFYFLIKSKRDNKDHCIMASFQDQVRTTCPLIG